MKIHVYHHFCDGTEKKLDEILAIVKEIKETSINEAILKEQAAKLDASTNALKEAIEKNTPTSG